MFVYDKDDAVGTSERAPCPEEKKQKAEATRDAMLEGITDEKQKAKATFLANAAISGATKVTKLTASLQAADADDACSIAYTKANVDSKLGVCVALATATASESGRRRSLAALVAYDVSLFFTADEMSPSAAAGAVGSLADAGVEGVGLTYPDPIEELKTVPGIDGTKLAAFDKDAKAGCSSTHSFVHSDARLKT